MDDIERLQEAIDAAERIVAFTGAGISTESGIPDFRSPGGIWTKYQPIEFGDFVPPTRRAAKPGGASSQPTRRCRRPTPNAGHRALARLVARAR